VDGQAIKVLLIEDNPGDTRLIREMLAEARGRRFNLRCCDCLSAGLRHLTKENINIILLDLGLPDSQGLNTLASVRTEAEIPVVVLSGLDDEATGAEAVRAGAQDYLVKGQVTSVLLARTLFYSMERFRMQKRMAQYTWELQLAELRLRKVIQTITDGILIVDKKGIVRFANPAAEHILNRKAQELLGKFFGFPVTAGQPTELNIVRSDRQTTIAEMHVTEIEWEDEIAFLVSLRNVTERKQVLPHVP